MYMYVYAPFFTAVSDYTPLTVPLVFQPGMIQECVDVFISSDFILESSEMFSVLLTTLDQAVSFSIISADVTIMDDDSELGISKLQYGLTYV